MNVETIDAGIWSSARAAGELQATVLGWFPLYADADNQMYTYYYSENAVGKGVFYNNPEFDSLMKEARESNDSDKRVELYKKQIISYLVKIMEQFHYIMVSYNLLLNHM